jgi:hypothetical protein
LIAIITLRLPVAWRAKALQTLPLELPAVTLLIF